MFFSANKIQEKSSNLILMLVEYRALPQQQCFIGLTGPHSHREIAKIVTDRQSGKIKDKVVWKF
jgi:hypothetical protein